jgi:hypothetical protein
MDLPTLAIIVSAIAALGGVFAGISFWMNRGKAEATAEQALSASTMVGAKYELLSTALADFKVDVARTYITAAAVGETEGRLTTELHRIADEMRGSSAEVARSFADLTNTLLEKNGVARSRRRALATPAKPAVRRSRR